MSCVVPGCGLDPSHQLIRFPQSEALCERWIQAITEGTGVLFPETDPVEFRRMAICSWHFRSEASEKYLEPTRFFDVENQEQNVGSCRFCLQFCKQSEMCPDAIKLGKHAIGNFIKQTLKINFLSDGIISDVCNACLVKIDLIKRWTADLQQAEAMFRSILVEASNENVEIVENDGTGSDKEASDTEVENAFKERPDEHLVSENEFQEEHLDADRSDAEGCSDFKEITIEFEMIENNKSSESNPLSNRKIKQKPRSKRKAKQIEEEPNGSSLVDQNPNSSTQQTPMKRGPGRSPKPNSSMLPPNGSSTVDQSPDSSTQQPPKKRGPGRPAKPKPPKAEKRPRTKREKVDFKAFLQRKCYICGDMLDDRLALIGHLTEAHASDANYRCEECDKTFNKVHAFNHHLSFHDSIHRPFKCSHCPIRFNIKENILIHENKHHNAGHVLNRSVTTRYRQEHQCEQCGLVFQGKAKLNEHVNFKHQDGTLSRCVICNKSFSSSSHLLRHSIVHSGEKPYRCEHCGKAFKNNSCLKNHLPKHMDNYAEWKAQQKQPPPRHRFRQRKPREPNLEQNEDEAALQGIFGTSTLL